MRRRLSGRSVTYAGWLAVILWAFMARPGLEGAQAGAFVSVEPSQVTLTPGETTRIAITITGAENLYGIEIHAAYDPAIIQVIDADPSASGVQIASGGFLDEDLGFPVANRADNDTGEMLYGLTLLAPAPPVEGAGTLLSFDIQGRFSGTTTIELAEVLLASPEGEALRLTTENGQVTVTGNQPATASPTRPPATASATATVTPPPMATATAEPDETYPTATATTGSPAPLVSPTPSGESVRPSESSIGTMTVMTQSAGASESQVDGTPVANSALSATHRAGEGSANEGSAGEDSGSESPPAVGAAGDRTSEVNSAPPDASSVETIEARPGETLEMADDESLGNSTGLTITVLLAAMLLLVVAVFFWKRTIDEKNKEAKS